MINNQLINIIVCSYNEAPTINSVISDLLKVDFIDKLFLVDDGSTDNTSKKNREIFREDNLY